jgi:hypothetical protein
MKGRSYLSGLLLMGSLVCPSSAVEWVRPGVTTNQPVWGVRGGLIWALPPAGFRGGEPRGLIRLGYPILSNGGYDLINFIAVEPIVGGRRGFSELEHSKLDDVAGKRIWADFQNGARPGLGSVVKLTNGVEELNVGVNVERFDNGAQVRLQIRQRSDRPDEIELEVLQEPDSQGLDYCILTATMGNMARTRLLWLKDSVVDSLQLYKGYKDNGFAPHKEFALAQLRRERSGAVLVPVTTDERNPSIVFPFPGTDSWHYAGVPVTQYWRAPAAEVRGDLVAVVNGRYTYWRSSQPVPGGVAFENFELRQSFHQGQRFIFGITRKAPGDPELK